MQNYHIKNTLSLLLEMLSSRGEGDTFKAYQKVMEAEDLFRKSILDELDDPNEEGKRLVKRGDTHSYILAVRLYKARNDCDLRDAKMKVDEFKKSLG